MPTPGPAIKITVLSQRTLTTCRVVAIDQQTRVETVLAESVEWPDGEAMDRAYALASERGLVPAGITFDISSVI